MIETGYPEKQGLYDPQHEHDACGFGFVVDVKGRASHDIVAKALTVLVNLEHRGAVGAEKNTGDGAGILLQTPHAFLAPRRSGSGSRCRRSPATRPPAWCSCPPNEAGRAACAKIFDEVVREEGQTLLGWRDVPTDNATLGPTARASQPVIRQIFVGRGTNCPDAMSFERKLYVIRRLVEKKVSRSAHPGAHALLRPVALAQDHRLQGDAERAAAPRVLPRPLEPPGRLRDRDGPLALLDEHLPVLVARAPVPLHLAQRRDQHAARQRQLDARAPVDDALVALRRGPAEDPHRRRHARAPTRRCSTTCSSCSPSPGASCRTR